MKPTSEADSMNNTDILETKSLDNSEDDECIAVHNYKYQQS